MRIIGKSLNHENIVSDVPAIELEGFDVPGYEAENITFKDCTIARSAEVRMHLCRNIVLQLKEID